LGTEDNYRLFIEENATDCIYIGKEGQILILDSIPTTGTTYRSAHVTRSFPVSAGTKTFYLNGIQAAHKATSDSFWFVNMKAIFHPD